MNVKLSYILPIFNVEKYLSNCLDSIYVQQIPEDEFEIVCVNDCSPDNSRAIILQYQEKHSNIVLIDHVCNKKAGGARNTGLSVAKGEYIWFVDPDDTVHLCALKNIWYIIKENKKDIIYLNYCILRNDVVEKEIIQTKSQNNYIDGVSFLLNVFGDGLIYDLGFPWRAIFKRELLMSNNIRFPEKYLYGEDTTFFAEASLFAKNVLTTENIAYNYNIRENSASSQLTTSMRGEQIYESIFLAGNLVNKLKNKAQLYSQELSNKIENGIPWFLNRLFIRLVRTSKIERNRFYQILSSNNTDLPIGDLLTYMDFKNRFIVKNPFLGGLLLNILSFIYKL